MPILILPFCSCSIRFRTASFVGRVEQKPWNPSKVESFVTELLSETVKKLLQTALSMSRPDKLPIVARTRRESSRNPAPLRRNNKKRCNLPANSGLYDIHGFATPALVLSQNVVMSIVSGPGGRLYREQPHSGCAPPRAVGRRFASIPVLPGSPLCRNELKHRIDACAVFAGWNFDSAFDGHCAQPSSFSVLKL